MKPLLSSLLCILLTFALTGCCATRTLGVYVVDANTNEPLPDSKVTVGAYPSPAAKSATQCVKHDRTNRNGWAYVDWPIDYDRGQVVVKRIGYRSQRMDNPPFPSVRLYMERIKGPSPDGPEDD